MTQHQTSIAILLCILIGSNLASPSHLHAVSAGAGANEYFTSNPDRRLLIQVQVWGSVQLAGIHHVPDNTVLTSLLGFVGGPKGDLENGKIVVRRATDSREFKTHEFSGDELLTSTEPSQFQLQNGDVIYVEANEENNRFMQRLNIVSTISALATSLIVTFFLVEERRK